MGLGELLVPCRSNPRPPKGNRVAPGLPTCLQMRASQLHAAGQLLPALQSRLDRPVPLPAAVSTAQAAAAAGAVALAGALLAWLLVWRRRSPTYLLDFECYRPGVWRRAGLARGVQIAGQSSAVCLRRQGSRCCCRNAVLVQARQQLIGCSPLAAAALFA